MDAVVIGPSSRKLGARLAAEMQIKAINTESRSFPDGESYIRIPEDVEQKDIVLLQSTDPPQDKHLVELFLVLDAAKDMNAKSVSVVVPYLAYARQDKRFRTGEAISSHTIIKIIEALQARSFVTFNVHKEDILRLFKIPAVNISAIPALADHVAAMDLERPLVAAPDRGSVHLAQEVAERIGAESTFFEKHRDRETGEVETHSRRIDVAGRDVIIVDDIISTGSTIANVAKIVKKQKARRVVAACVHPVLAEGALPRMREAGVDQIVGTDCVDSPVSEVTVAPLLAQALRKTR